MTPLQKRSKSLSKPVVMWAVYGDEDLVKVFLDRREVDSEHTAWIELIALLGGDKLALIKRGYRVAKVEVRELEQLGDQ